MQFPSLPQHTINLVQFTTNCGRDLNPIVHIYVCNTYKNRGILHVNQRYSGYADASIMQIQRCLIELFAWKKGTKNHRPETRRTSRCAKNGNGIHSTSTSFQIKSERAVDSTLNGFLLTYIHSLRPRIKYGSYRGLHLLQILVNAVFFYWIVDVLENRDRDYYHERNKRMKWSCSFVRWRR